MSDRRSFSEIPAELLREHGDDPRVDRIWRRLEVDLGAAPRARSGRTGAMVALAALAFSVGVVVGSRGFAAREPDAQLAALGAEPSLRTRPAAATPAGLPAQSESERKVPRARGPRSAAGAPRIDTPAPIAEPAPVLLPQEAPVDWRQLADDGRYGDALAALEQSGGFDGALRGATADQLMSLVDVARATGQRERAVVVLRRIVSEHGSDPNAPVAAWMLGNELTKVRDLVGAEQAFAMYRALSPNGDFAEDALARQVDMASEQGHVEHARKLAVQYLKEFPDGPRSAEFQGQLAEWAREPQLSATEPARAASSSSSLPDAGAPR